MKINVTTIADAAKEGAKAARESYFHRFLGTLYKYDILDNPHRDKKLSVAWHNAFYDERKRMIAITFASASKERS